MKRRHAELLLIGMVAVGFGAELGFFVAWLTLR